VNYNTLADAAYVGDDDGYLHKISPFFLGTPAEVITPAWQASHAYSVGNVIVDSNGFFEECTTAGTSGSGAQPGWSKVWSTLTFDNTVTWTNLGSAGGWPLLVTGSSNHNDNVALNGPIFDAGSKNIFVGDLNGSLYYVLDPGTYAAYGSCANELTFYPCVGLPGTTTGITPASGAQTDCSSHTASVGGATCLVMSNSDGFTDSVIVDSVNKLVITQFSNADGVHASVEQTNTTLGVFNSVNVANAASMSSHSGNFDNNYYVSPATGSFYFCGPDNMSQTEIYQIGFTNTAGTIALATSVTKSDVITTPGLSADCSPVTEIYNTFTSPAKDWLFLSVDNNGKQTACNGGPCVLEFNVAGGLKDNPDNGYEGTAGSMNGTGGIIVDNYAAVSNVGSSSVADASESGTTATITTAATLGVAVGQTINVSGMASAYAGYDSPAGGVVITCVGAGCASGATLRSFSYTASTSGLSSCSGTGTCGGAASYAIAAATESGTTATLTTSTPLGVIVGQNIRITAMAAGYSGYDTADALVTCVGASCATGATANSFSYTASSSGLSSCSSTAACSGSVQSFGFGQASSLYFMPVANNLNCGDGSMDTGCAVKLTQAGLK
jgi:hypothetical protein